MNYFGPQTVPPPPPSLPPYTSYLFLYWGFRDLLLATLSVHKSLPYESKLFMLGVTKYSDFQTFAIAHYLDFSIFQDSSGLSPECPKPGGSTRVTETQKNRKKHKPDCQTPFCFNCTPGISLYLYLSVIMILTEGNCSELARQVIASLCSTL